MDAARLRNKGKDLCITFDWRSHITWHIIRYFLFVTAVKGENKVQFRL